MAEVLKKFGRYFLLDHLAQGGMAEIYRARLASPDGAGRLMVIKRIQANFGQNSEFLQMFKSEIRVTMGFNHPNIVQLYDFGEEAQQPFIAMEWVDGKNLRQYMSRFAELKQTFPIELAAYIIEQAAGGLHYAHSFKDKFTGQALNIVHRDISPQNILISYEGTVKIIDFGIAKANTNSESTRAGVIKGKPSYLAPEQISGEVLDGRCDLFALGTVLWELLTGKKLFAGENDLAVLKLIESAQTHVKPPSTLNPKVPKELDYIVLRALAKQREKRFQSGEEMQRALHKFLYAFMPEFNPQDLAYYAKDLFKNDIVDDRKKIQRLNDKVEQLLAADVPDLIRPQSPVTEATPTPVEPKVEKDTTTVVDKARGTGAREFEAAHGANKGPRVEIETAHGQPSPNSTAAISRATKAGMAPRGSVPPMRTTGTVFVGSNRQNQSAPRPVQAKSGGSGMRLLAGIAAAVAAAIFAPQFGVRIPVVSELTIQWTGIGAKSTLPPAVTSTESPADRGTASVLANNPSPTQLETQAVVPTNLGTGGTGKAASARSIQLRLAIIPGCGGTVSLNGKPVSPQAPLVEAGLDEPLELSVERPGYKPFRKEFQLSSRDYGALREAQMTETLEPREYGKLSLNSRPTADRVTFTSEGCSWQATLPMQNERLPAGDYTVRLVNTVLGAEKELKIRIEKNKAHEIQTQLQFKN